MIAVSAPRTPARLALRKHMALLGGAWTAAGVALYLILPLAAPSVLALAVIAPLAWSWAAEQRPAWRMPPPALALLALATVYLLINASWSPSRGEAYATVDHARCRHRRPLHRLRSYLPAMPPRCFARHGHRPAGRPGGGRRDPLLRGLEQARAPAPRGQSPHRTAPRSSPHAFGGRPRHLSRALLVKFSMALFGLLFWPAGALCRTPIARLAGRGLPRCAALARGARCHHGFVPRHLEAGVRCAAAVYGIGRLSLVLAKRLPIAGRLVATLLVAPFAMLAYSNHLHLSDWLGHRPATASSTGATPAPRTPTRLRSGPASARCAPMQQFTGRDRLPGRRARGPFRCALFPQPQRLPAGMARGGAVGVGLLLILGLLILRAIAAQPPQLRHSLYASFASAALLAASSFSLWAPWFLSALALTALFACLATALPAPVGNSRDIR